MCDICKKHPCDPRCPNAEELIEVATCNLCKYPIYGNDTYVISLDDEIAHIDCLEGLSNTKSIEWLGGEIIKGDEI